jgi:hypothetical protein
MAARFAASLWAAILALVVVRNLHAAGVDVEGRTEVGHAHRRALDVPAGSARTDRRLPGRLARLGPLPHGEVADIVLAVFVGLDSLPHPEPFGIEAGQAAVRRPRGDPEEDRAVVRPIGVAALEQRCDQLGHLVDVLGRPRQDVRDGHAKRGRIGQKALEVAAGQDVDPLSGGRGTPDDLVVDVGVEDPGDRQASPSEMADQQVDEEERPKVADVDRRVDRGAAGIDAHLPVVQWHQRSGQAGQRVVQLDRHRADSTVAIARALMHRPAPSGPSRLPLDALTLTAARSSSSTPRAPTQL